MRGALLFLLPALCAASAVAQDGVTLAVPAEMLARTDSLRVAAGLQPSYTEMYEPPALQNPADAAPKPSLVVLRDQPRPLPLWMPPPASAIGYRLAPLGQGGGVQLARWDSGAVAASALRESLPGLMGLESGTLSLSQQLGDNVIVTVYGAATKAAYFRGMVTQYTFGGTLDWRINSALSLHLFGSYTPGSHGWMATAPAGGMAMVDYLGGRRFGGYLTIDASSHFGIDVGAQAYYDYSTGRYRGAPIVMPYYKTSWGAKLGVDVGGILYEILKNRFSGKGRGNPSISAPFGPGSVRPSAINPHWND